MLTINGDDMTGPDARQHIEINDGGPVSCSSRKSATLRANPSRYTDDTWSA
jgi:hypothetical protein